MSRRAPLGFARTRRRGVCLASACLVASGALTGCLSSSASTEVPTIGFLRAVPGTGTQDRILTLLEDEGFIAGRNLHALAADPEEVHPQPEDARATVRRWVTEGVDLIVAQSSTGAAIAAEEAPDARVVFLVNDPIAVGLVADEHRPEGRLTGVTFRVPADRTLALARRAIPGLDRIGLLYPATDPAAIPHRDAVVDAGARFGIRVIARAFNDEAGIAPAVDALAEQAVDAVLVSNSPTSVFLREPIARAVAAHRLPIVANTDRVASALVVLQPDVPLLLEQLGRQVVRLLRGASPSDVPVEDPDRFELVLNEVIARDLGITLDDGLIREAVRVVR